MSLATSNRDGGRTNEAGHLRGVTKGFIGQVLTGLAVVQRGAGANMSVDVPVGDAIIQRSDGTYGHPAWNDATLNQVIAAADGSNPRRDIIVMYIDYNQTPSTGVANNTNGVVKITSVAGTAAGSPVDPSNATIQSAVGSGNPWIKLARVRVAAGATSITNSVIDDLRIMATGMSRNGWIFDSVYSWVYASASTFTIAGVDARDQFPVGTKLRLYQGGTVKYFIVTQTAFSTNTTITVASNGVYTLANSSIDTPAFSYDATPSGYPATLPVSVYSDYSTTETDTGKKWTNGKPIYRRVLNVTIPSQTNGVESAYNISDTGGLGSVEAIISAQAQIRAANNSSNDGSIVSPSGFSQARGGHSFMLWGSVPNSKLWFYISGNGSARSATFIIEYTKP